MLKRYIVKRYKYNPYAVPFYVEDLSGQGGTLTVDASQGDATNIEYSTDAKTWSSTNPGVPVNGRVYMRANATKWSRYFSISAKIQSSRTFAIGGNLMSLMYGSAFTGNETEFPDLTGDNIFYGMFMRCSNLVDAGDLLLPAMTMVPNAYFNMFATTNIVNCPKLLPATTLATRCYEQMLKECRSLTNPPVIAATVLAPNCFNYMFERDSSLHNGVSLTITQGASNALDYMYSESAVNSITVNATTWGYNQWLYRSPATGTVYINPALDGVIPENSTSGIPSGWSKVILNQ